MHGHHRHRLVRLLRLRVLQRRQRHRRRSPVQRHRTGGGSATITVRFANGGTSARTADLVVNGSTVQSVSFEATGAWSTWVSKALAVSLPAGSSTIRLNPTTSAGLPNVDHLDVSVDDAPVATALYVATNGDDSSPGTLAAPLRTVQKAVDLAQPGHTIYIRGGTYAPSTNIQILKNGTSSQPITMRNHDNEHVILDGENVPYTPGDIGSTIPRSQRGAIHIEGDHWRLIGLEIIHGPYGIFGLDSHNNVYDRLVTRDNYETGLHLVLATSNNQILNLDSYGNRDPRKNGESADGLAIKEGSGTGNVVRGARLWNNADDGLDYWMFSSPSSRRTAWPGATGQPLGIERSTAWDNPKTGFQFERSDSTLTKNLAAANGTDVSLGSNSSGSGNSWDIGGSWQFKSTNPGTMTGPRKSDGSIPSSDFLRPSNGADVGARF